MLPLFPILYLLGGVLTDERTFTILLVAIVSGTPTTEADAQQTTSNRAEQVQSQLVELNSKRTTTCERWLKNSLTPRPRCALELKRRASNPWMMNSTETSLTMENDVYAVSNLQQTAFAMIERCGDAAENRRVIRSELLSDAAVQQEGVVAFLMEENERRRRWVDRLLRLVWLNYEEIGLGAPEIDPWNSVAANEWMGDSMFVLDNLDVLSMFQLTQSLNKVLRWLEVDNFLRECATGHNTYHSFRRYFSSSLGLDKARSDECDSAAVKRKVDQWRDATNPEVADEVDHELIRLISKCLPNVFELSESDSNPFFQHEGDVHEDVLEYEQLYNLLGFLRSNWGDLNALSRPHVVSFFETTIRGLGGLMSAFHLTGHPILMYMGLELDTDSLTLSSSASQIREILRRDCPVYQTVRLMFLACAVSALGTISPAPPALREREPEPPQQCWLPINWSIGLSLICPDSVSTRMWLIESWTCQSQTLAVSLRGSSLENSSRTRTEPSPVAQPTL